MTGVAGSVNCRGAVEWESCLFWWKSKFLLDCDVFWTMCCGISGNALWQWKIFEKLTGARLIAWSPSRGNAETKPVDSSWLISGGLVLQLSKKE